MRNIRIWIVSLSLFFSLLFPKKIVIASSCPHDDPCRQMPSYEKVTCYTNIVNLCVKERENMTSQITYLTTKIELTKTKITQAKEKINQLEEEIESLTDKIERLESSLTQISSILIDRIKLTYKYGGISYLNLLLGGGRFSEMMSRYKYIQTVQAHDRRLLFQLQNSKLNYQDQKNLREEKRQELDKIHKQLEKEQIILGQQRREKELFLTTTQNSEVRYRQELLAAQKEAEGIEKAASILSAAGVAKRVSKGEVIGIMGNTGFSTGPHLHLSVYNLKESELNKFNFNEGYDNPFNLLISRSVPFEANSCDNVGGRENKTVGTGSWEWPMVSPIISQCFGHTPWSWRYPTSLHNGIDMYDDVNTLVRAVEAGNAYIYRGGQATGNGVFIFHDNGKMTLYWHLQ